MKQVHVVVAVAAFTSLISLSPAGAAPPTVTPSPGYDARLQEERAAQSVVPAPTMRTSVPMSRHPSKRPHHHRAH